MFIFGGINCMVQWKDIIVKASTVVLRAYKALFKYSTPYVQIRILRIFFLAGISVKIHVKHMYTFSQPFQLQSYLKFENTYSVYMLQYQGYRFCANSVYFFRKSVYFLFCFQRWMPNLALWTVWNTKMAPNFSLIVEEPVPARTETTDALICVLRSTSHHQIGFARMPNWSALVARAARNGPVNYLT